jgi:DeoR family transcriptional regulator, deoxyribose operon repressor
LLRHSRTVKPKHERIGRLIEAVSSRRMLPLSDAAIMLGVSEMTVRRDIAESGGRLNALGGYVVSEADLGPNYVLDREADSHRMAKAAACEHALSLVEADDAIFIDCGTTTPHLASRLPNDLNLTVVCYAINLAEILAKRDGIQLVVMGGIFHPSSASFSGEDGLATLRRVRLNKAFVSAGGVHPSRGVSCSNFHEVAAKRAAIENALVSYLVIDSSKFGKVTPAHFAERGDFRAVICEEGISAKTVSVGAPSETGSLLTNRT